MCCFKEEIECFINAFEGYIKAVNEAEFGKDVNKKLKKIFYLSIIDTLAKTTSDEDNNRKRFTRFIREFCDWDAKDKISLPHFVKWLEKFKKSELIELKHHYNSSIHRWYEGLPIKINIDPDIQEIEKKYPKIKELEWNKIKINKLKHIELFYNYRNLLVHELREPGYPIELENDLEPFYTSMRDIERGEISWELVYPVNFFEKLCTKAVLNLKEYFLKKNINPYNYFTFGTYWIKELN